VRPPLETCDFKLESSLDAPTGTLETGQEPAGKTQMSHMFCTLQEAARTLNASEDQIKALLERGLLHEFREGPHCLLKEADVGALALRQRQRREPSSPAAPPTRAGQPSPSRDHGAQTGRPVETRRAPTVIAGSRPPQLPRPQDREGRRQRCEVTVPGRLGVPHAKGGVAYSRRAEETGPRRPDRRPSDGLSIRQWFWMGLVQDRPVAIALLAGLALGLLSALVAGLCYLAQVS